MSLDACLIRGVQPDEAARRGALQLLDAMDAREGAPPRPGPASADVAQLPSGFLEDFAVRFEAEGLEAVIEPIGAQGCCHAMA